MRHSFLTVSLAMMLLQVHAQDNLRMNSCDFTAAETAHYMAPGWNLGNTLEGGNNANVFTNNAGTAAETAWQPTVTSKAVIDLVRQSGFKSVRIPCSWVMGHIADKESMTIDPAWLTRVKEVVDYCIGNDLFVILNDHWDGGWLEYDGFTTGANVDEKKEQLRKLWTNIATAFADYDGHLIFAGLNEPGVGGASPYVSGTLMVNQYSTDTDEREKAFADRILEYEQVFVDAVRATGGNNARRILVVQGPKVAAANTAKFFDMKKLADSAKGRIMVEIHNYDPYAFCQMTEDADWGKMKYYWNGYAPRRADSNRIGTAGEQNAIQRDFNNLKTAFVDNGYPVIVGEYGAVARTLATTQGTQQNHDESRQYWYKFSTSYAMEAGCIPFVWDINNTGYKTIDRVNVAVGDEYNLNGIMEGVASAQSAYNAIYPEPSTESGIGSINSTTAHNGNVYDMSGRIVKHNANGLDMQNLSHGIYIYNDRKYVK